ncbi:MAG: DinB superfamily protein [Candidatus Fluviicola riflensis]|nr:MAG: DinB superfamily protein [Candidatus Fluviicola riflensis]OGS79407.1 MAG: DinB superfamily protein [Candidatus Fluviicola riflensis]OGS86839.1 MAG: DinB superfamily protein [Fluviicola sp. RIFCSPHIGHO2_01_FULL_43_53]OGS89629.1 MAG: DinB superfamily protein [Fluviicola sp. RIFCSPHIGHO2_12_FULL_43_24]
MKQSLITLFERDIQRLYNEIQLYTSEQALWILPPMTIHNTAGNLALHLCGNLNHFIGATLGKTGYIRERDLEFSTKDVPVAQLLKAIEDVKSVVIKTLEGLSDEQLNEDYPLEPLGYRMTTTYFLIHLNGHLNYHLGQINYHRRLLKA